MSSLRGYALRIPGKREKPYGYVQMEHGEQYRIALSNNTYIRCEAQLFIDGKEIGTWRLGSFDRIILERPPDDRACFTAYLLHSKEGRQVELEDNADLGLIKAVFTPELIEPQPRPVAKGGAQTYATLGTHWEETASGAEYEAVYFASAMPSAAAPMGTGLSGHSDQEFRTVESLKLDYGKAVTLYLRLMNTRDEPRPLKPTQYSSPYPRRMA